jgi:hypothetical protein
MAGGCLTGSAAAQSLLASDGGGLAAGGHLQLAEIVGDVALRRPDADDAG